MSSAVPGKLSRRDNIGDSDVSPDNTPSQFLLFRGLEPSVNEELLAKGGMKLYKDSRPTTPPATSAKKSAGKVASTGDKILGAREDSLRRVLLVKDRQSSESWRYGFAEFATVEDAKAALQKYETLDKFTIKSKPVEVSLIHAGVFVPVFDNLTPSGFTFSPLNNAAIKLRYWDEEAFVSEHVVTLEAVDTAKIKEKEARKIASAAEKEGLVKPGKDGVSKLKKRKAEKEAEAVVKKV
jgi:RNA-binding protein 5/10